MVVGLGGNSDSTTEVIAKLLEMRPGEGELCESTYYGTILIFSLSFRLCSLTAFLFFFLSLFLFLRAISKAAASGAGIAPITCCKLMSTMKCNGGNKHTNDVLNILDRKNSKVILRNICKVLNAKHHCSLT